MYIMYNISCIFASWDPESTIDTKMRLRYFIINWIFLIKITQPFFWSLNWKTGNPVEHTIIRFQKTIRVIVCWAICMKDIALIAPTEKETMIDRAFTDVNNTVQKTLSKFGEVNTELLRVSEISFQCLKIICFMNNK